MSLQVQRTLGQRVSQTVDSVITQYLLDTQPGLFKVLQADNGSETQRYVHDQRGILSHQDDNGDWNWMIADGLGSVRGVYDETLAQVYTVDFDPYGNVITETGSNPTPFGYPGEWTDENGLVYLRARYYDPVLGNFFNLDPLETDNRYAYVNANPTNLVDPSGFIPTPNDFDGGCSNSQTIYSGDCVQVSTGLLHAPSTDLTFLSEYGISLTVECELGRKGSRWTPYIQDTRSGLEAADNALKAIGSSVKNAFQPLSRPLEFRIVSKGVGGAGRTINSTRVHWSTDGMDREISAHGSLEWVIVHELGHVLENRNDLKSAGEVGSAQNRWLPDRFAVHTENIVPVGGTIEEYGEDEIDETRERVADYFLFWVYQGFNNTPLADVAQAFLFGDKIVLWQRSDDAYSIINSKGDIEGAIQAMTSGKGCSFDFSQLTAFSQGNPVILNEGKGDSCEIAVIQTEGLSKWVTP